MPGTEEVTALTQVHARGSEIASAHAARRLARPVLAGLSEPTAADALLLVSELVTNGLLHARTEIELHVRVHRHSVFIAVRDQSPNDPRLKQAAPFDPGGRGLHIVAALAQRWGVHHTARGKLVWCEIQAERVGERRPAPRRALHGADDGSPPAGGEARRGRNVAMAG